MITQGQFNSFRAHVMTHLSSPTPALGVLAGIHPTMPYMTTRLRGYTPPRGSNELEDGDEDWIPLHDGAEVKADEGNEEGKTLQDQLEFQVSL